MIHYKYLVTCIIRVLNGSYIGKYFFSVLATFVWKTINQNIDVEAVLSESEQRTWTYGYPGCWPCKYQVTDFNLYLTYYITRTYETFGAVWYRVEQRKHDYRLRDYLFVRPWLAVKCKIAINWWDQNYNLRFK